MASKWWQGLMLEDNMDQLVAAGHSEGDTQSVRPSLICAARAQVEKPIYTHNKRLEFN